MNSDETGAAYGSCGTITTYVYDAQLGSRIYQNGSMFDVHGRLISSADLAPHPTPLPPAAATEPRTPLLRHTFEFRLSGTESQEQSLPLPEGSPSRPADAILAIQNVRTYLTREGELVLTSAIGGVEVDADLRPAGIFCTARLSDFGHSGSFRDLFQAHSGSFRDLFHGAARPSIRGHSGIFSWCSNATPH